jgi:hypothetical protein
MVSLAETSGDPLSEQENTRLRELECTVAHNLSGFLETGKALLEIREGRLYREHYDNFDSYLFERWGISRSRARDLISSVEVTKTLLAGPAGPDGDAPLPIDLSEKALQPLAKLSPELRCATWRLASKITDKPSHNVICGLVRIVKEAINEGYGREHSPKPKPKPKPEEPPNTSFLRGIYTLSAICVAPQVIVCDISDRAQAARCVRACKEVARRCHFLVSELTDKFPGLC